MHYKTGENREQNLLFPESLDDYVAQDNPVRFLEAFVEELDFETLGFKHSTLKSTGCPPFHPADLLKLYLYGYLNRIHSSRKLQAETYRNLEVLWLLKKLHPDFRTISNFRKDNKKAIKLVSRQFILLCKDLNLFSGKLVAIDGSKFRAQNSKDNNFTKKKLENLIARIDKSLEDYTNKADEKDAIEAKSKASKLTEEELQKKIESLKERKKKYETIQEQLEQSGEKQISLIDPDSRSMKMSNSCDVCYNVQTAVDEKHKLILVHQETNIVTDRNLLSSVALEAKETLQQETLDVTVDQGYFDVEEVEKCIENGITPYMKRPSTSANKKKGLFTKEEFRYDKEKDCYICPANQELKRSFSTTEKGREITYYKTTACNGCPLRAKCTENKRGRRISRIKNEHLLEEMEERVLQYPEKVKKRGALVEHPFGTIKGEMRHRQFLTRGLEGISGEMSLSILAYNMKRVLKILGMKKLMEFFRGRNRKNSGRNIKKSESKSELSQQNVKKRLISLKRVFFEGYFPKNRKFLTRKFIF